MSKDVTITISPDGADVKVDAEGFMGSSCKDFMGNIMKALGSVTKEEKKPQYYKTEHGGVNI